MENVTFEEYKRLMMKMVKSHTSVYIESEIKEFGELVEKIEAVEDAHPEYEEML